MIKVLLTGSSGFVGRNLVSHLGGTFHFLCASRGEDLNKFKSIESIIHLAGLAHDIKNTNEPQAYYTVNTNLTKKVFDDFLASDASVFITLSSVKAVADKIVGELTENHIPDPVTDYGKSKLLAEEYVLNQPIPTGKRVYILRPCMIHGPNNKGNLNLLYKLVSKGIPWPLGSFQNKRSFCSIENLIFIIKDLIERDDIPSGVYNVSDDEPLSTNDIISLIAKSQDRTPKILNLPKKVIQILAAIGDKFYLPLNSERLHKLTESYIVSNTKIKSAIGKPLPISSTDGLLKTFHSFK